MEIRVPVLSKVVAGGEDRFSGTVNAEFADEERRVVDREVAPTFDGDLDVPPEEVLCKHRDEADEVVDVGRYAPRRIDDLYIGTPNREHAARKSIGPHACEWRCRSARPAEKTRVETGLEHALASTPEHAKHEAVDSMLVCEPKALGHRTRIPVVVFPE